jgi:hypothetical protein
MASTIAATANDVATGPWLDSFVNDLPNGGYEPYAAPWTGTQSVNCNDWNPSGGAMGAVGIAGAAYYQFFRVVSTMAMCTESRPLFCFEP